MSGTRACASGTALVVVTVTLALGCGDDEEKVSAAEADAAIASSKIAAYCLATTEGEPTDHQWQEKQDAVRDLLRLLRDDPDAAREDAADAAGMLDDCGEPDDATRLDRARDRS